MFMRVYNGLFLSVNIASQYPLIIMRREKYVLIATLC